MNRFGCRGAVGLGALGPVEILIHLCGVLHLQDRDLNKDEQHASSKSGEAIAALIAFR